MSSIQRQSIVRGPGAVVTGADATTIFDRDNIKADLSIATFDVPVSAYGNVDTRRQDITGTIAFRPSGAITAAILAALYPHGTPSIGASLCGATDVGTVIHGLDGRKLTFHSTCLTGMPSLRLSSSETAFSGEAQIQAVVKNDVARTTANSLYTEEALAFALAFDTADVKGGVYSGVWGTDPSDVTFFTKEGWEISFEMETEPVVVDGIGTVDHLLTGVTVTAKCQPLGLSADTVLGYLNAQGAGAVMGGTMRSAKDLVISAAGALTVTLREVAVMEGPLQWGNTELRIGEVGFRAHRKLTSGVPAELFSVAMTA